jgi:hypothetical protein
MRISSAGVGLKMICGGSFFRNCLGRLLGLRTEVGLYLLEARTYTGGRAGG